jgi:hypothetical protein
VRDDHENPLDIPVRDHGEAAYFRIGQPIDGTVPAARRGSYTIAVTPSIHE